MGAGETLAPFSIANKNKLIYLPSQEGGRLNKCDNFFEFYYFPL